LVTDSGSADNAITALSNASLQIGQPPISKPATPITLTAAIGSPHAEPDQRRCERDEANAQRLWPPEGVSACAGVVHWCGAEDDDGGPQENSEINVVRFVNALLRHGR